MSLYDQFGVFHQLSLSSFRNSRSLCLILKILYCVSEEALERDNYMSSEEAKNFGVIDHVIAQASENSIKPEN